MFTQLASARLLPLAAFGLLLSNASVAVNVAILECTITKSVISQYDTGQTTDENCEDLVRWVTQGKATGCTFQIPLSWFQTSESAYTFHHDQTIPDGATLMQNDVADFVISRVTSEATFRWSHTFKRTADSSDAGGSVSNASGKCKKVMLKQTL